MKQKVGNREWGVGEIPLSWGGGEICFIGTVLLLLPIPYSHFQARILLDKLGNFYNFSTEKSLEVSYLRIIYSNCLATRENKRA